jgi:aminoglycoside 3-N-acetyltransferase
MRHLINILARRWNDAGINPGDLVLIHSSLRRTLNTLKSEGTPATPQDIFESFCTSVGPEGTVLFPTFNFGFCSGESFDIRHTPSKMGALTECARLAPSSVRTGHPIYSFSVLGKKADLFKGIDNISGYGTDSPFAILHKNGGKIASLDLDDQNSMTFYHYIEEHHRVPYRYFKGFTGPYTDWNGVEGNKTYKIYVRDINAGVKTNVNPAGEMLWLEGLYVGDRPGEGSGLRIIDSNNMFDFISDIIDRNMALGNLYIIDEE